MKNAARLIFTLFILAVAGFLIYKFILVRTVNYEIGGIKIPSRYNFLTGSVKPISNYSGKANLSTVEARKSNKMGLTEGQVVVANLRWAVFEQWAAARPEYRGWQKDARLFKKAHDAFKKELESYSGKRKSS